MKDVIIREIKENEFYILEDLLYEAIYQEEDQNTISRDILKLPEISQYIDNFGSRADDYCLIADMNGQIIGGVWVRILADEIKGYGNVGDTVPELSISLFREYRGRGIGSQLMNVMIEYLKSIGYEQVSLSVSRPNYAVKMYKNIGFVIVETRETDYLMLLNLKAIQ